MSRLDLDDFRAVLALAEARNFHRAAHALGVAQSTLSARIARIEKTTGAILYRRGRGGAEPTPAAQALADVARRTLDAAAEAELAIRLAAAGRQQRLRVGVTPIAADRFAKPALAAFRAMEPDAAILLTDAHSHDLEIAVEEGRLDIAFLHPPLHRSGLAERFVGDHRLMAVRPDVGAPPPRSHDVMAIDDLIGYPRAGAPNLISAFYRALDAKGRPPAPSHESNSSLGVAVLAAAGYGTAIVAEGAPLPAGVKAAPLVGYEVPLQTVLAWRQNDHRPIVRQFLKAATAKIE